MTRSQVVAVGRLLCSFFLLSLSGFAQSSNADRLIEEALKPSPIEKNLQTLSDEIGGRVPGTRAMRRAVDWGVAGFKAAGADEVHTEEFNVPVSWSEGATEVRVFSDKPVADGAPVDFNLRAVSIAWAPPVMAKKAPVVDVGLGTPEDFQKAGDISGKVLLVHSDVLKTWADLFNEYTRAPPVIKQAVKGHARAIMFMATR